MSGKNGKQDIPDQSFARDAYLGIDLDLPGGVTIHATALTLTDALHYMGMVDEASKGDINMTRELFTKFPAAIGVDATQFEHLTPGEMFEAIMRFFAYRRPTMPEQTANESAPVGDVRQPLTT